MQNDQNLPEPKLLVVSFIQLSKARASWKGSYGTTPIAATLDELVEKVVNKKQD